jgi:carbon starvation protein
MSRHQVTAAMAIYAFAASVLPMWMLLTPRGYLSTFMKIGTIAFLALGVVIVNPTLQAPAFSSFVHGGGPIIPGRSIPSSSSRSRAAQFQASTRSSPPARRRRW